MLFNSCYSDSGKKLQRILCTFLALCKMSGQQECHQRRDVTVPRIKHNWARYNSRRLAPTGLDLTVTKIMKINL